MHASTAAKLATFLGIPLETLELGMEPLDALPDEREPIPSNFLIRRVSRVAASDFTSEFEVNLHAEEGVPGALYPEPLQDPQLLLVVGDSMRDNTPDSIEDGDEVLFGNALEEDIPDGELVVALNLETSTQVVKRVKYLPHKMVRLISQNPKYKPIDLMAENVVLRRVLMVIKHRYKRNSISSPGATRPPTAGGDA
jgi:hypothetical protein